MQNKVGALRAWTGALACALTALTGAPPALAAPATVEGVLETIVEDHPDRGHTRHFLKTDKGRVELRFVRGGPKPPAGARVRASGQLANNVLALADSGSTSMTVTAAAPLQNTTGELKTAVLLVNFVDDASQPYSVAQARDMVFTQVSGFMRENSFQRTWLAGDAFGWFNLPIARTCDGIAINSYARHAAANAGVDLAAYGRFIYVFPRNSSCGWSGAANVGGTLPSVWINGKLTLQVVAHEVGHTLGLHHAHSMDCGAVSVGANCTTDDYGDSVDTMGNNAAGHFSAFNKERLGWLNAGAQPPIATAQSSGRYTIEAYSDTQGVLPKALKIARGTDPVTGAPSWYYIEYRQPVGYDMVLANIAGSNYLNGLMVRIGSEADLNSGTQLDMTPGSSSLIDWHDSALPFGQSYVDPASGVTVVAVSGANGIATLDVTLNAAPAACQRAAPALALVGGAAATAAGGQQIYTLTLTNRDSAGCAASAFDLAAGVPAGWGSALGTARLTANPGNSASTALTVASLPTAVPGTYPVSITATHGSAAALNAASGATFTVAGGWALNTTTNQGAYRRGETVIASTRVMAGSAPAPNLSVSFVFTKADGSKVAKTATTDSAGQAVASLRIGRKDPAGSWTLTGTVAAAGQNGSAAASFQVQ